MLDSPTFGAPPSRCACSASISITCRYPYSAPSTNSGPSIRSSKAPTLVLDDGTVLMDSTLIIDYAEHASGRTLMPDSLEQRRQATAVIGLALAACEKTVQIVYERNLRPTEKQHEPWVTRVQSQLTRPTRRLRPPCTRHDADVALEEGRPVRRDGGGRMALHAGLAARNDPGSEPSRTGATVGTGRSLARVPDISARLMLERRPGRQAVHLPWRPPRPAPPRRRASLGRMPNLALNALLKCEELLKPSE